MKDLKETIKGELLNIITKATELSVLIGDSNFPETHYRYVSSLTRQSEVELTGLAEEVSKDLTAGRLTGSNNPE